MPVLPLLITTLSFYYLALFKLMPKNKVGKAITETMVMLFSLSFAPPFAIALFPQYSTAKVETLEPHFHNLKDSEGNQIRELYYNKGL
jgi:sideroflexin-5